MRSRPRRAATQWRIPTTCAPPPIERSRSSRRPSPRQWREAAETADFDVITATLDRVQAAAAAGEWSRAEQARLEAYGVFELGPEQRLRGLGPSLFQRVEQLFWYGHGEHDGLVLLIKRRAPAEQIAATRAALDEALAASEERIGSGPGSRVSIVTNSAIIVFREGLEAVLILAALMASLVGRAAPAPAAAARRRRARTGRERRHVGGRADGARVARRVGREALRRRRARRDRRAAADPQLVLPPRLLAGEPAGPAPPQEAHPRRCEHRHPLGPGARARGARVLERLPRGLRDRPLPAGADPRSGRVSPCSRGSRSGSRRSSASSCSSSRSSASCRTRRCSSPPG